MRELDTAANLRVILSKLPYKIKEKWRTAANDILEETNHRAGLKDLSLRSR